MILEGEFGSPRASAKHGNAPLANEGLVGWLLACPEKDFFVPIESEATGTFEVLASASPEGATVEEA